MGVPKGNLFFSSYSFAPHSFPIKCIPSRVLIIIPAPLISRLLHYLSLSFPVSRLSAVVVVVVWASIYQLSPPMCLLLLHTMSFKTNCQRDEGHFNIIIARIHHHHRYSTNSAGFSLHTAYSSSSCSPPPPPPPNTSIPLLLSGALKAYGY